MLEWIKDEMSIRSSAKKHPNVGKVIYSEYFGYIQVSRFVNDVNWYFRLYSRHKQKPYGGELRANTRYSFFDTK